MCTSLVVMPLAALCVVNEEEKCFVVSTIPPYVPAPRHCIEFVTMSEEQLVYIVGHIVAVIEKCQLLVAELKPEKCSWKISTIVDSEYVLLSLKILQRQDGVYILVLERRAGDGLAGLYATRLFLEHFYAPAQVQGMIRANLYNERYDRTHNP